MLNKSVPKRAYDILGVTPRDDFATIRKAWRALARAYHPDVAGGCPDAAQARFAEINAAYDLMRFHRKTKSDIDAEELERQAKAAARRAEHARRSEAERKRRARMEEARNADAQIRAEADRFKRREETKAKEANAAQRPWSGNSQAETEPKRTPQNERRPRSTSEMLFELRKQRAFQGYRDAAQMPRARKPAIDLCN